MKILVLCHGNINRSPLCAQVLREQLPADKFEILSAGFGKSNQRASKKTRDYAGTLGYNLEEHRSTVVNPALLNWSDLIIYMDGGNKKRLDEAVSRLYTGRTIRACCLGQWDVPESTRIPDPAFLNKDSEAFRQTIRTVIGCSQRLACELLEKNS